MANEVTLNFTAEQIDVRLENASNAILHTEQTLTEEQKAQARENIGIDAGGGAKVINLDNYTTADGTTFNQVIETLLMSGEIGGVMETDLTQLFEDATTGGALILKLNIMSADIVIHGVTACCNMFDGVPQQLSFMCWVNMGMGLMSVTVLFDAFTCDGKIAVLASNPVGV